MYLNMYINYELYSKEFLTFHILIECEQAVTMRDDLSRSAKHIIILTYMHNYLQYKDTEFAYFET